MDIYAGELLVVGGEISEVKSERDILKGDSPVVISRLLTAVSPLVLWYVPASGTGYGLKCDQVNTPPHAEQIFNCRRNPFWRKAVVEYMQELHGPQATVVPTAQKTFKLPPHDGASCYDFSSRSQYDWFWSTRGGPPDKHRNDDGEYCEELP